VLLDSPIESGNDTIAFRSLRERNGEQEKRRKM